MEYLNVHPGRLPPHGSRLVLDNILKQKSSEHARFVESAFSKQFPFSSSSSEMLEKNLFKEKL